MVVLTQVPLQQVSLEEHLVPHVPQLLGSVCGFTQVPLHTDCPCGQAHWPPVHTWSDRQQVPPPVPGSAPHREPLLQTQLPFEQVVPDGQTRPHAPQLVEVLVAVQVPLQTCWPLGHWQVPLVQVAPEAHLVPHPPQLFLSVSVATHWPLQSSCPAGQVD